MAKYKLARRYTVPTTPAKAEPAASSQPSTHRLHILSKTKRHEKSIVADAGYELTDSDIRALKNLVRYYEKTIDYVIQRNRPLRLILLNILSGVAKGFGIALGITVIAFIAFKILNRLELLNLPLIGDFIAELLDYINTVSDIY